MVDENLFMLILFTLAVYRATRMLTAEHGFAGIFTFIRRVAGIRYVEQNRPNMFGVMEPTQVPETDNVIGQILTCFYCCSVWVAMPIAIPLALNMGADEPVIVLFWWVVYTSALSAGAIMWKGLGK